MTWYEIKHDDETWRSYSTSDDPKKVAKSHLISHFNGRVFRVFVDGKPHFFTLTDYKLVDVDEADVVEVQS